MLIFIERWFVISLTVPTVHTKPPERSRPTFNPNPSVTVQQLTNFDGELVVMYSVHVQ